jgi:hypothetical protein
LRTSPSKRSRIHGNPENKRTAKTSSKQKGKYRK